MIVVIDYGLGNLRSIMKSFKPLTDNILFSSKKKILIINNIKIKFVLYIVSFVAKPCFQLNKHFILLKHEQN